VQFSNLLVIYATLENLSDGKELLETFQSVTKSSPLFLTGRTQKLGSYRRNIAKISKQNLLEFRGSTRGDVSLEACNVELSAITTAVDSFNDQSPPAIACQFLKGSDPLVVFEALLKYCKSPLYMYTMPSKHERDEIWYALGVCLSGLRTGEFWLQEEDDVALWQDRQTRIYGRFQGRLRNVYPLNAIALEFGTTVSAILEWSKKTNGAELSYHSDMMIFRVPTYAARQDLRQFLLALDLLICKLPFPDDNHGFDCW